MYQISALYQKLTKKINSFIKTIYKDKKLNLDLISQNIHDFTYNTIYYPINCLFSINMGRVYIYPESDPTFDAYCDIELHNKTLLNKTEYGTITETPLEIQTGKVKIKRSNIDLIAIMFSSRAFLYDIISNNKKSYEYAYIKMKDEIDRILDSWMFNFNDIIDYSPIIEKVMKKPTQDGIPPVL